MEVVEPEHRSQMPVHRRLRTDRRGVVEQDHIVSRRPKPRHEPRHVLDADLIPGETPAIEELEPEPQTERVGPHRVRRSFNPRQMGQIPLDRINRRPRIVDHCPRLDASHWHQHTLNPHRAPLTKPQHGAGDNPMSSPPPAPFGDQDDTAPENASPTTPATLVDDMEDTPNRAPENGGFGRPVRHVLEMPGGDLVTPFRDRSTELLDLWRTVTVLKIRPEAGDELERQRRMGVIVDRADDFLRVPCGADLASWIAGGEKTEELGAAVVIEGFIGFGQQPAEPVERIVLVAPVAEGFVLHASADIVEALVRQVRSARSALSALLLVGFFGPSPEPDVRLPTHPALHEPVPPVKQRSRSVPTVSGSSCRGSGSE